MILENCSGLKNGIIFTKKYSFRTFRNSLEIFFFCIKKFLKWNFFGSSRLLFTISLCAYFFAFLLLFLLYIILYILVIILMGIDMFFTVKFLGVGKKFGPLMHSYFFCRPFKKFSKTVHTILMKFCTVIMHPKGPLRAQRHQNCMTGM